MRFTWDKEVDAAYMYFKDRIGKGESTRQIIVDPGPELAYEVILDLDEFGQLLGLEILGASVALSPATISGLINQSPPGA